MNNPTNIFHDGYCMEVNVSYSSLQKSIIPIELGYKEDEVSDPFNLGKKSLVPRSVIKEIRRIESKARFVVESNSFKFPIGNARFVPKKRFPRVIKKLKEYQENFNTAVQNLINNYEKYKEEMRPLFLQAANTAYEKWSPSQQVFGAEGPDSDKYTFIDEFMKRIETSYPNVNTLKYKFALDWSVYEIAVPRLRKGDADQLANSQKKKEIIEEDCQKQVHEKIENFVGDVVKVLRQETMDICNKIVTNIKDGKVIRHKTIQSLKDFVDRFSDLNFVGDIDVEEQLNSLRKDFLDTHENKQFADDVDLQDELKRRLGEIAEKADVTDINSITGQYSRKISWK